MLGIKALNPQLRTSPLISESAKVAAEGRVVPDRGLVARRVSRSDGRSFGCPQGGRSEGRRAADAADRASVDQLVGCFVGMQPSSISWSSTTPSGVPIPPPSCSTSTCGSVGTMSGRQSRTRFATISAAPPSPGRATRAPTVGLSRRKPCCGGCCRGGAERGAPKLREALQRFATEMVEQHGPPEVDCDPAKTKNRLGAVLAMHRGRLGRANATMLDTLCAHFEAVNDVVQRLEHGDQKDNEPVTWEQARAAVYQAMNVMFEFDRLINR